MPLNKIIIATRKSPLALWQAEYVKALLLEHHPELKVELLGLQTQGDQMLNTSLSAIGGKGLFIKELEQALYEHCADIAVHSMKDVTIDMPEDLILAVILKRHNPHDVLVSAKFDTMDNLPEGAIIGTSSLRRQCQLKAWRRDIQVRELRGNVGSRLKKLNSGEYDAIILAAAGMIRLGLEEQISEFIPTEIILPAIGQGAIGIQIRKDDHEIMEKIYPLRDDATQTQVETERVFSKRLFGGCQLPIAAHAEIYDQHISLRGMVGRIDGSEIIKDTISGNVEHSSNLGSQLAENLLSGGADKILQELLPDQDVR